MPTSRQEMMTQLRKVNHSPETYQEQAVLAFQVQNLAKQRALEAVGLGVPLAIGRRLILPRLGIAKQTLLAGFLLDCLAPSVYFFFQHQTDKKKYAKMLGLNFKEDIDKETQEKRQRFITQFWSNSQYWH